MSDWSAKNPYDSTVTVNYVLNGEGSKKETRHVVFDLGDSGMEYKAGDALGVLPVTSPELVDDVIVALGANPDEGNTAPIVLAAKQGHSKVRKAEARQTVYLSARLWLSG